MDEDVNAVAVGDDLADGEEEDELEYRWDAIDVDSDADNGE
jgi:hypothetical protein